MSGNNSATAGTYVTSQQDEGQRQKEDPDLALERSLGDVGEENITRPRATASAR
jgi:hypothetical protein